MLWTRGSYGLRLAASELSIGLGLLRSDRVRAGLEFRKIVGFNRGRRRSKLRFSESDTITGIK